MAADPWQQWQAFAAAAQAFLGAAPAAAAPPGEAAARVQAARQFGAALRDLFAQLEPPWSVGGTVKAPGRAPSFASDSFAMGATREHQLRWQRLSLAWQQLDEAQRRMQRLWTDALREAAVDFAERLGQPAAAAPAPEDIRHLYATWIDCAERAYARIAHGAPFCDALAESVNAGSRWRCELKALVEQSATLLDLPTRSELNSLHQRLRAVEAALREVQQPGNAPTPPTSKRPKRRRTKS